MSYPILQMENAPKKSRTTKKPTIKIEVTEVPVAAAAATSADDSKKKGRKGKGGKLVVTVQEQEPVAAPIVNIILHLKCSTKDLNEYIEKKNRFIGNGITYDPSQPPDIQTYNVDNSGKYSLYDDSYKINNSAYQNVGNNMTTGDEHFVCKKCKIDSTVDNSVSMKDVQTKLKNLKMSLYKNVDLEHKPACFWCTCSFDTPTCYIPKHETDGVIYAYGAFCRPECAVAYLMKETMDDSIKFERYHLLNHIYGKIYGYSKNIKPAPNPYYTLDKYYGNMTIQEYRKMLKSDIMLLTIDKPMTRLMPELHEETDETLLNIGNSSSTVTKSSIQGSAYKVKRQSEKAEGPTKSTIMKTTFGLA